MDIRRSPAWLASFSLGFIKYEISKTCCSGLIWIYLPKLFQAPLLRQILKPIFCCCCFHFCFHIKPQDVQFPLFRLTSFFLWETFLSRLIPCAPHMDHRNLSETPCFASISQTYLSVLNEDREDWTSALSPIMICLFKQVKVASNNQSQTLPLRASQVIRFCLPVQLVSEH